MHKGFALGWVLSGDGNTVLFGDEQLTALAAAAVQVVRFDLQLGSHPDWDDTILGHYSGVVNELTSARIDVIGLLGPGIVPGAKQGNWNVNEAEHHPTGGGDNPFLTTYADKAQIIVSSLPAITHCEIWHEPH